MGLNIKDLFSKGDSDFQKEVESGFKTASLKYDFRDKTLKPKAVASDMFTAGVNWGMMYAESKRPQESNELPPLPEIIEIKEPEPVEAPSIPDTSKLASAVEVIINWVKYEIHNNFKCHMSPEREKMLRKMLENLLLK